MNCPACNNELTALEVTGVKVQACAGSCGGLWFERKEIQKLTERLPGAGVSLLHVERAPGVHIFRDIQHPCPRCLTTLLYRHCFSREFRYEVDQCAKCAGFWIDPGTLAEIAAETSPEAASDGAAAYFKSLFEDNLAPEHLTHFDTHEAAQLIHSVYQFLTPGPSIPVQNLK